MQKSNRLLVSIYVAYNSPEVVLKSKLEFFRTFDVSGFGVDGNIIHEWDEMLHESWDSTCCAHDWKIPIYLLGSIIASQHWFKTQLTSFLPIIQHSPSNCQRQTHLHSYHPHTLHLHLENSAHLTGGLSPCHLAVKIRGEPRLFQRFINRLDQNIVHVYIRYAIAVHLAQLPWLKFNLERPRDWKSRAQSVFENVEIISMAPVLCRCGSSCIVPPTSLAVSL